MQASVGSTQAAEVLPLPWKSQGLRGLGRVLPKFTAHSGKALPNSRPRPLQPTRESGADLPLGSLPEPPSPGAQRNWGIRIGTPEPSGPPSSCRRGNEEGPRPGSLVPELEAELGLLTLSSDLRSGVRRNSSGVESQMKSRKTQVAQFHRPLSSALFRPESKAVVPATQCL